jgi:mannose-6-phosphate isomerase-like protein (cupin superfamily)
MVGNFSKKSTTTQRMMRFGRQITFVIACACAVPAADRSQPPDARVDIYSAQQLKNMAQTLAHKQGRFASQELARYSNHYTMLAIRESTGSAELHEHEADVFVIESGQATLVTGGKIVNPHTQKPGEIRGTSIEGGERHPIATGDIVHIPAGTPHQLLVDTAQPFVYFVVKVTGQ